MIYILDKNYETTDRFTDHYMIYESSIASAFENKMPAMTRDNYLPASHI